MLAKESIKSFCCLSINIFVVCCDVFLSNYSVILLLVYFFNLIVIETSSFIWLRNHLRFFVQIFDYMEYPWLQMFNTFLFSIELIKNVLDCVRIECKMIECIDLKWIEDQKLVECWDV